MGENAVDFEKAKEDFLEEEKLVEEEEIVVVFEKAEVLEERVAGRKWLQKFELRTMLTMSERCDAPTNIFHKDYIF